MHPTILRAAAAPPFRYPFLSALQAYWPMGEASGNRADALGARTLADNGGVGSGAGVNGFGTAALFDGNTAKSLQAANNAVLQARATGWGFDGWVFLDDAVLSYEILSKTTNNTTATLEYRIFAQAGGSIVLRASNGSTLFAVTGRISAQAWHHVAAWYDPSVPEICLAVDGLVMGTPFTGNPIQTTAPVYFGSLLGNSLALKGREAEWACWNPPLT